MLNILVSYAFMSDNVVRLAKSTQGFIRWTLDSGAFSAFNAGKVIELSKYIEFCQENGHLFDHYVALDVIGNAKESKLNLEKMVAKGLKPMAVLTGFDNVGEARELSQAGNALCVAGGVSMPMDYYSSRIAKIRDIVGDEVWLHGLGFGRGMKVASTRINGVDASSWEEGLRWGSFGYFVPAVGVKSQSWSEIVKTPWSKLDPGVKSCLVSLGLKKSHLADKNSLNRGAVSLIGIHSAYSWLKFASALEERGVRFNFAVPGYNQVLMNLVIAAKYAQVHGISWSNCLPDQQVANKTFRDPQKLIMDLARASKNAEKVFNIK